MPIKIVQNVSLAALTTLQAGGAADYFSEVTTRAELEQALRFAQQNAAPVFVLGGGSNVLFPDEGYRGLVIKNSITGHEIESTKNGVSVRVGAGEEWDALVSTVCAKEYWGIENLSAIPGTVGATPIQNVGAYGVEVSDVISEVVAMHIDTFEIKYFTPADCQFSYRDSYFKSLAGKSWVVVSVTFNLRTTVAPNLQYADLHHLQSRPHLTASEVREAVIQVRANKFPDWNSVGTAGSFFKNPVLSVAEYTQFQKLYPEVPAHQTADGQWKLSLGWVLDKVCGLKGFCVGAVCLYEKQALVLINTGDSAENIHDFVTLISKKVFEKTKIKIEAEVLLIKNKIR